MQEDKTDRKFDMVNTMSAVVGDITQAKADAIVNPAAASLQDTPGGLNHAIHQAAGPALQKACKALHGCKVGQALITGGYNLQAKYVIHTVGPTYHGQEKDDDLLASCYGNSLDAALVAGCHSVVFPAISTGSKKFPHDAAAKIAVGTVGQWFADHPAAGMQVTFCCCTEAEAEEYRMLMSDWCDWLNQKEAEKLCAQGAEAYEKGDFATALPLYKRAAEKGSIIAMCNLGYCYYYGRSVSVDKQLARSYWETAAILGNTQAVYKLGDMHRNGDIEQNEDIAWLYYLRAFNLEHETQDLYVYPDICLRLAKYGEGRLQQSNLAFFAETARQGFVQRIARGDPFSNQLLAQAEALCSKYTGDTF